MNEEAIKTYEADLELFCGLAADSQIEADSWSGGDEAAICWSSRDAFNLAAIRMMRRLEDLWPTKYWHGSLHNREVFVANKIKDSIKEKTDHEQKTQPLS